MNGIPTLYKGVQFRSRLEATWAAFWDLTGEDWQYEPIDLAGYIPDFVLVSKNATTPPFLVEVKPEFTWSGLLEHTQKIVDSGWRDHALVVGTAPLRIPARSDSVALGLFSFGAPDWKWHHFAHLDRANTELTFAAAKNVVQWQSGTRAGQRDARTILTEAGV